MLEDQTRTNQFFIFAKDDSYISTITITTIVGSTTLKLTRDKKNAINISLRFLGSNKDYKDKKSMNIVRVIRLLLKRLAPNHHQSFDYIWKLLSNFITPKAHTQCRTLFKKSFLTSFEDGKGNLNINNNNDDEFLYNEMLSTHADRERARKKEDDKRKKNSEEKANSTKMTRVRMSKEEKEEAKQLAMDKMEESKEAWIRNNFTELLNDLFPQISSDNIVGKLNMLLLMLGRFLEFLTGYRKADNQDDWGTKKIINAGPALLKIFSWWYRKMFNAFIPNIPQATQKIKYMTIEGRAIEIFDKDISSIISGLSKMKPEITTNFEKSFTYDWGNKKKAKMKPVKKTDILKNANILDMLSHMLRISAQVDERSMNMAPRMVRNEQAGFIDPVDTPEGGTCGLVRAKSIACIVTVDRDDTLIYYFLIGDERLGGIRSNKLSTMKTTINKTICLLNSKFMGWCNGDKLFAELKRAKRKLQIYYETSLVLEKTGVEVLFIHTDGGRPIRPFLVVDPVDNRLVIDKKNLWDVGTMTSAQHFNMLIRKGAVEYLSPVEQSATYVSMSVDFLNMKQSSLEGYRHKLEQLEDIKTQISNEAFYTVSGQTEVIINSNEKERIELEEINKITNELHDEQEKLERISKMTSDEVNEIADIEKLLLNGHRNGHRNGNNGELTQGNVIEGSNGDIITTINIGSKTEDIFGKGNVSSLEKLKEVMSSRNMQDSIREYAIVLHQKQKTLYEGVLKADISKLEELTNGETVEQYNKKFNDAVAERINKLQHALLIEQKRVEEIIKNTNVSASVGGVSIKPETIPGNEVAPIAIPVGIVRKIENIQRRILEEQSKKNIYPRVLGINELKQQIANEKNEQLFTLLNNRLQDRINRIEQLKTSIKSTFATMKSITLDNFIAKVKYDIIAYHKRELERKNSLISYTKTKINELMLALAAAKKASSIQFESDIVPESVDFNSNSDVDVNSPDNNSKYKKLSLETLQAEIVKVRALYSRATREVAFEYCEVDPNAIWGISASVIPLSDRNQSIRNSYVCNHLRQMVGITNTNPEYQMDTTSRSTAFPNRPLIEPQLNKIIGVKDMPIGATVILAIATHKGMNQEDSLIVSQKAVDLGLFKIIKHKTIKIEISPPSAKNGYAVKEEITNIPENAKRSKESYRDLINGIVGLGTVVDKGDPLVSITRTVTEGDITTKEDASRYATIGEDGLVDRITPPIEVSGIIIVKIRLLQIRNVVAGDKLGTLSGQKGTISKIVREEDMPFGSVYNPRTGQDEMIRPDIIMNPHAIPSRMTLELLFEIILGRYAAQAGARVDATSFKNMDIHHFMNLLPTYGFSRYGTAKLYNGETGEFMDCNIMTGPTYYALLKHWVLDKIQSHGIKKKVDPQTGQPVKGRSNEGAIRMGAQERDALFAHGAASVALERYCISSDRVEVIFCNNCGNLMDLNVTSLDYKCRFCEANDPVRVKVPYGIIKFIRYMGGVGFKISFSYLKSAIPEIMR